MFDFLQNLSCNLLASLIFLLVVFVLLRPRLDIADAIAKDVSLDGKVLFFFKICNKSFFRAYDIRIELYQVTTVRNSGNHIELQNIAIHKSVAAAPSLGKFSFIDRIQQARQDKTYEFALQFKTKENIEDILRDNHKFVRLQVEARHGLTGLQSIFVRDFDDISSVYPGAFQSGKTFRVSTRK